MPEKMTDRLRTVELDYMRRCLQDTSKDARRIRTVSMWMQISVKESIIKRTEN